MKLRHLFPALLLLVASYSCAQQISLSGQISTSGQIIFGQPAQLVITFPACGTPPCLLAPGGNGTPYNATLLASGGTQPYTWSCPATCNKPGWLTISSGGVLSGTAATGTTVFAIQVCDAASNCTPTLSVSLTITGSACGPPTYPCASTSTANPGTITSPFVSSIVGGNAATCTPSNQCQNATAEDTTIPGHLAGTECITRISDGSVIPSGKSIGNLTLSGGDNDSNISRPNGTYFWYTIGGGSLNLAHLTTSGGCLQVVNTGIPFNLSLPGGAFSTSQTTETRYYYFTTGAQNKSMLTQGDLTSDSTATVTNLFDFMATGNCPGPTPFLANFHSLLTVSKDDDIFTLSLGTGAQGTADWVFQWSRTLGCRSVNYKTGQYWAYCTSSCGPATPATGTFATGAGTCWGTDGSSPGHGIHDVLASADGTYIDVADTQGFTQGGSACATGGAGSTGPSIGSIALGTTQWCNNSAGAGNLACGSHESLGQTSMLTPGTGNGTTGPVIRPLANVTSLTQFEPNIFSTQLVTDMHCSWGHNNGGVYDDTLQWICASDDVKTTAGTVGSGGCTTATNCPNYLNNAIYAMFPAGPYPPGTIKVFAHTYECGNGSLFAQCPSGLSDGADQAIGVVSPKGDYFCWESGMLQQLGTDNNSKPRKDAFCIMLQ